MKGSTGLGLSLKGGTEETTPICVKGMQPHGIAFLSGLIEVGDEIVEINGQSQIASGLRETIDFLKSIPIGPVRFLTRRKTS